MTTTCLKTTKTSNKRMLCSVTSPLSHQIYLVGTILPKNWQIQPLIRCYTPISTRFCQQFSNRAPALSQHQARERVAVEPVLSALRYQTLGASQVVLIRRMKLKVTQTSPCLPTKTRYLHQGAPQPSIQLNRVVHHAYKPCRTYAAARVAHMKFLKLKSLNSAPLEHRQLVNLHQ